MKRLIVITVLVLLTACASQPQRDLRLDRLRDQLAALKADSEAELLAPLMISDAERAVRQLEAAGRGVDLRNHLAYLAERRIELAVAEVQRKQAQSGTRHWQEQAAELRVTISRMQAEQARMEAEQARLLSSAQAEDAARARDEAESAREAQLSASERAKLAQQEAETARKLAAARAQEAELARREAELASQQAESLRRRLEHMQLRETDRGVVVTLGDVLFASGESELKDAAAQNVTDVVDLLAAEPDKRIRIEGHTDSSGDAGFNLQLSEQRAQAVRNALVNAGVAPDRITVVGLGEDFPIASNDTAEGRSQNRRVDVILLDE